MKNRRKNIKELLNILKNDYGEYFSINDIKDIDNILDVITDDDCINIQRIENKAKDEMWENMKIFFSEGDEFLRDENMSFKEISKLKLGEFTKKFCSWKDKRNKFIQKFDIGDKVYVDRYPSATNKECFNKKYGVIVSRYKNDTFYIVWDDGSGELFDLKYIESHNVQKTYDKINIYDILKKLEE